MSVRAKGKKYKPRKKFPSQVGENRVGQFRRNHQDTAVAAAHKIKPHTGTQRTLVYKTLLAVYPEGLTDQEIIEITGIRQQSENPRRWELVKKGRVIPTEERRLTESGCKAIVWKAVPQ
jgi:hypothetical protein